MTNVLEYLENAVRLTPDKICYLDDDCRMTFRRVAEEARAIGSLLARRGVCRRPVAVFMKKGPRAVTAFLGALYGGCFYVPLDIEMPMFRIELILGLLGDCPILCDDASLPVLKKLGREEDAVLYETAAAEETDEEALDEVRRHGIDTDPVYVLFTSGSTGIPKGVITSHRALIDYVDHLSQILRVDSESVFGNQTPLYTDACLKDLYPTLKCGATTVFIPKSLFSFPVRLLEYLNRHRINTVCWVASALSIVSSLGALDSVKPRELRTVAFGSEVFPVRQLLLWQKALPEARFINLYGPTECTGCCCFYELDRPFETEEVIPIGKPFPNAGVFLLSEEDRPVPQGELGEICIKGTGLAYGYYKNPQRTAEVFVQNPLNDAYPERIYRTGDLGRFNERGELIYVTRKDFQIKHMGYRIELGEIEVVCAACEGVSLCCAVYDREKKRILLYYTGETEKGTLLGYLKGKLPRYMLPAELIRLRQMPLTLNRKIDRKRLETEGAPEEAAEESRRLISD